MWSPENASFKVEAIKDKIESLLATYDIKGKLEILKVAYNLYLRENVVGPSFYTQYVEETKAPIVKGGPLPEN